MCADGLLGQHQKQYSNKRKGQEENKSSKELDSYINQVMADEMMMDEEEEEEEDKEQEEGKGRHQGTNNNNNSKHQANGTAGGGGGGVGSGGGGRAGGLGASTYLPGAVAEPGPAQELLRACEANKASRVKAILASGLDPNSVCDDKGRWPIHIAAAHGFTDIASLLLSAGAQKDQADVLMERTPLHLAAMAAADTVELLLRHGADVNARNKYGSNALHYAAGAGQAGCCRLLASAGCELNARDRNKLTPLHVASRVGDVWCIEVLLEFGANVSSRDKAGKTPMHHAAEGAGNSSSTSTSPAGAGGGNGGGGGSGPGGPTATGSSSSADDGKGALALRRLTGGGANPNSLDDEGKSVLFYAVQGGSAEAVRALCEMDAELSDGATLLLMSRTFPHLIRPFLDAQVRSNIDTLDPDAKGFSITFDYTPLTYFPKGVPEQRVLSLQNRNENEAPLAEMGVLHGLTRVRDTSILTHPLCESLLKLKWNKVKWYLYADMLLFALFLSLLTAVIFIEYEAEDDVLEAGDGKDNQTLSSSPSAASINGGGSSSPTSSGNGGGGAGGSSPAEGGGTTTLMGETMSPPRNKTVYYCTDTPKLAALWSVLWVLTSILAIREFVQMCRGFIQYITDVENLLEVSLLLSVMLLSFAECGFTGFVTAREHFAAVCLIVGWTTQVMLYGKIPMFGVYIRMYGAVATSILGCLLTFLGLLFAFGLTLHFLFRTMKEFDSVWFTFLKTFAMLIGELDLARTFTEQSPKVPFTSHLIFALFIIFISVILSSLLVSLAVAAINSMQRDNEYLQLVQLINVTSQLEDMLKDRAYLYPHLNPHDIKALHLRKGVIYPNKKDHGRLTKDAMEIVINQNMSRKASSAPKSSLEVAEELLTKLRVKLDKYILDVERKGDKMAKELRAYEKCADRLAHEVRSLKFQLERVTEQLGQVARRSFPGEGSTSAP